MIVFIEAPTPAFGSAPVDVPSAAGIALDASFRALGLYAELVDVVVTTPWSAGWSVEDLRLAAPSHRADRVAGSLWDKPTRCTLSRYEHIRYWLDRTFAGFDPSWIALQAADPQWPSAQSDKLITLTDDLDSDGTRQAVHDRLSRYTWADDWWGEGAPPGRPLRRLGHRLMLTWCIPRPRWGEILGSTCAEFEKRIEDLLEIHAAARRHVREGKWPSGWVHLLSSELQMRRPIELIASGPSGIREVRRYAWRDVLSPGIARSEAKDR